ncbi:hypothetical protein KEX41_28495 (plasmid) [Burkholderia thailandensis]|uniref:hypothetical protein n=1 Tax=Burkholderia thailandensis TaxID=57975 RepID=UPI00192DBD88|nr:hypothetical protein [Burkholderia thailandensis]MBS2132130.1 hypothetical protein [Burkholderia thailandensis]QRA15236.1 hypothetical protein JMY07_30530 [Burkholderia thailandensis]
MKTRIALSLFAVSTALAMAANVQANDAHHPASAVQPGVSAPKASAGAQPAPAAQSAERYEDARRQMQKMLAQMEEIRQTKDPAARQRLMDEHMRTMQDTMRSMHGMGGPMMMDMMGQQGMGGTTNRAQSGKRGSGVNERMDMMEKRMDMMQMMMDQMLQQQNPPTPAQ